jgi:hypothetical protein
MNFNQFKQETTSLINELNKLSSLTCGINFDKNCEYPCCFNPNSNSIIFNYDLLNENNQSALYFLGDNYLKYFILHEYGHFKYNEDVNKYINKIIIKEPDLANFIKNYNDWIKNDPMINLLSSYLLETYWQKQSSATCEFMADYFVIEQIKKNFNYLNPISFKLWRASEILTQYNYYHNNNCPHIIPLRYYHIPETILDKTINFENDSIIDLINLSLKNSIKSLKLIYNQSNNINEYNATNFNQKISDIIEELNMLR